MARRRYAVLVGIAAAALVGCAEQKVARPVASTGATSPTKTIVLGSTRLDPSDLTVGAGDTVGFVSTAGEPLRLEFIRPKAQADTITCRVADPKSMKPGEKAWGTFQKTAEGHFAADIPPGRFLSVCTFKPGAYTYTVQHMEGIDNPELRTPQEGTITAK